MHVMTQFGQVDLISDAGTQMMLISLNGTYYTCTLHTSFTGHIRTDNIVQCVEYALQCYSCCMEACRLLLPIGDKFTRITYFFHMFRR